VAKRSKIQYPLAVLQLVALCTVFFGVLYYVDQVPKLADQLRFDSAERINSYSLTPPVSEVGWRPVDFVDYEKTGTGAWQSVWYRLQFDRTRFDDTVSASSADDRWAVYIEANAGNVAVFLNGNFLGDGGNMVPPIPAYRRPQIYMFPVSSLKDTANELYIHYVRGVNHVWVRPIYLGPYTALAGTYAKTMLMKLTLPLGILMMMAVITVIMLLIFYLRPQDKVYGWYTASTLVWMVHHAMKVTDQVPIENQYLWRAVSYLTLALFVNFGTRYLGYFARVQYPKVDRLILWWSAIGGSLLFLLGGVWGELIDSYAMYIWVPSILLTGSYGVGLLVIAFRRDASTENLMLLLAIGLLLVVGIRDYVYDFTDLVPGSMFYLQFAAGFVMTFWGLIFIRRFVVALDTAEVLNDELEGRVIAKTRELEVYYEQVGVIEKDKALAAERERLMRDMHDGLGGQLVHLLAVAEQDVTFDPIKPTLRTALRDLRLIIDSLSIVDGDLVTVLATFRHRTEKMVKEAGLKFDWRVEDLPALDHMGPEAVLQVLRILQEAVTNIIGHAAASTISVRTQILNGGISAARAVLVEIRDDGHGFGDSGTDEIPVSAKGRRGRGLTNMRYRAARIGAEFSITSDSDGTRILLTLPLSIESPGSERPHNIK